MHRLFFSIDTCHLENCIPADQYNKRFGEIDSETT